MRPGQRRTLPHTRGETQTLTLCESLSQRPSETPRNLLAAHRQARHRQAPPPSSPFPSPPLPSSRGGGRRWPRLPGVLAFLIALAPPAVFAQAQEGRGGGPECNCGDRTGAARRSQRGGGDEPPPGPVQKTRAERHRTPDRAPRSPLAAASPERGRRGARGAALSGAERNRPLRPCRAAEEREPSGRPGPRSPRGGWSR